MQIDRRQFLAGLSVGALGLTGIAGMTSCTSGTAENAASEKEVTSGSDATPSGEKGELMGTNGDLSFLGEKPSILDSDIDDTINADIVIVGGGHAGIQCAKSASENGLSVAVIEKLSGDESDHYYLRGQDVGHFNSEWLIKQGFGPYDTEEIVQEFAKRSSYCVNFDLIRSYVENSGIMFDSMVALVPEASTILDSDQVNVQQCYSNTYPYVRGGNKTWAATAQFRGGILTDEIPFGENSRLPEFEMLAVDYAKSKGAQWFFDHTALVLDQEEEGAAVKGVITKNSDGHYIKFEANKAVVLAAGDFGGDGLMAWHLCEEVRNMALLNGVTEETAADSCSSFFANSGDGQRMGLWAGGFMDQYYRASMAGGGPGGPLGSTPLIYINATGKRFMNECQPVSAQALFRRTQSPVYTIWDANWEKFLELCGVDHGSPDYGVEEYIGQCREDMAKVLESGTEGYPVRSTCYTEREGSRNICFAANTLDELADLMDLEDSAKENFLKTIADYNQMCSEQRDILFDRDKDTMIPLDTPPFYFYQTEGSPTGNCGLTALSGLMTDENMNVLNVVDQSPIKGLYAAGNCLGGRYAVNYSTPCAGNSIGMAMTNGYVLGNHLSAM